MDCLFCKIVAGKTPSKKIYEDEYVFAFEDIQPQAPMHFLFVPKEHFESLSAMPAEKTYVFAKIMAAVKQVADKEGISKRGFRTVMNTNHEGGQTVNHVHVHLMAGKQMGGNMTGT